MIRGAARLPFFTLTLPPLLNVPARVGLSHGAGADQFFKIAPQTP